MSMVGRFQQLILERLADKLLSQQLVTPGALVHAINAATTDDGATWRSLDSSKPSFRVVLDVTNDRVTIERAAAAAGNLTWVRLSDLRSTGPAPACSVYGSGNSAIPNNSETKYAGWDTTRFDTDSMFSIAQSRITVPLARRYSISATLAFASNSTGSRYAYLRLNGSTNLAYHTPATVSGQETVMQMHRTLSLNANDYIEVVVWQNSGADRNIMGGANWSNFEVLPA